MHFCTQELQALLSLLPFISIFYYYLLMCIQEVYATIIYWIEPDDSDYDNR